jgi:hypothetical protein
MGVVQAEAWVCCARSVFARNGTRYETRLDADIADWWVSSPQTSPMVFWIAPHDSHRYVLQTGYWSTVAAGPPQSHAGTHSAAINWWRLRL